MEKIEIKKEDKTENGWRFLVKVDGGADPILYSVDVEKSYWEKLTKGQEPPAGLVQRSFEFLLAREPKESILREFDLSVIQKYFPEYEDKMRA